MKRISLVIVLASAALAQSGLDVPQAGMMVDHSGALRALTGIEQSFLAGGALRTGVLSAACGQWLCFAKTDTSLFDARNADDAGIPTPAGPAILSIHRRTALLYFPTVRQFARYKDGQMQTLDWSVDGEVLAISAAAERPRFAVRRGDNVWIIALDGSIQSALPAETTAVLLMDGATLYAVSDAVVLRHTDGTETSFSLPGAISLSQLSEKSAQISTAGATYALLLDPGREQLSLLPDAAGAAQ